MLQLNHISVRVIIFFLFNFPIIVFNVYYFNIYTFPTFLSSLPFHLPTTSSIFLPPLPFHLLTTLYINIILPISLHRSLFLLFLFTLSYYKFVTISSILCIVFSHKKKMFSLSLDFLVNLFIFLASLLQVDNFLYSLKLYFGLMRFSFVF